MPRYGRKVSKRMRREGEPKNTSNDDGVLPKPRSARNRHASWCGRGGVPPLPDAINIAVANFARICCVFDLTVIGRICYNSHVIGRVTAWGGHSPGTDRERQATHEGRHPFPPPNEQFNLQCCKAVALGNLRNFRERYLAERRITRFLSSYSRRAFSGPLKEKR